MSAAAAPRALRGWLGTLAPDLAAELVEALPRGWLDRLEETADPSAAVDIAGELLGRPDAVPALVGLGTEDRIEAGKLSPDWPTMWAEVRAPDDAGELPRLGKGEGKSPEEAAARLFLALAKGTQG